MLAHLTDALTLLITNLYVSTGLIGIILAMAIESCCIPLPSEIVMPLAGVMLVSGKLLPGTNSLVGLALIALAGAIGCLIGSIAAYGIGYGGGRPLMLRYGRYLLISQHDADKADHFFQKWGSATAFFSRLLPVVRTYISLPAGIAKMPFVKFCIYTVLGSFLWSLLLAYVGTIIGGNLAKLSTIFHSFDVVILVVLVVLVALYIWRHIRNDRKAREALATSQAVAMQSPPPQPGWGQQQQPPQYQQQGQPQPPQQQNWNQQPAQQSGWNQPPQQFQPPASQPGWNQPSQTPPPQLQPPQSPGWNASPQPPQQGWGQQPSAWPPQNGDNDRTVRRS
ncbi:MAG: DedA family protein [Ktedonobacteraceae bacterium]